MTTAEWAQSPLGQEEIRRAALEASNAVQRLQNARHLPACRCPGFCWWHGRRLVRW